MSLFTTRDSHMTISVVPDTPHCQIAAIYCQNTNMTPDSGINTWVIVYDRTTNKYETLTAREYNYTDLSRFFDQSKYKDWFQFNGTHIGGEDRFIIGINPNFIMRYEVIIGDGEYAYLKIKSNSIMREIDCCAGNQVIGGQERRWFIHSRDRELCIAIKITPRVRWVINRKRAMAMDVNALYKMLCVAEKDTSTDIRNW